jgi:Flp pilus assembly protein TadG
VKLQDRATSGQGLVEFALVFPLIMLLLFGVIDFGRAIYAYNTLSDAARQADRTAIVNQTTAQIQDAGVGAAPALGLTRSDVCVSVRNSTTTQTDCTTANQSTDTCTPDANGDYTIGCLAFVTVKTTFTPLTPVVSSIVGTINLSSTSVGPIEYVCPYTGHATCP